jgi:hypothetical protein
MTTTILLWTNGSLTAEQNTEIQLKAQEMQVAGKTDNDPIRVELGTEYQFTRTWTTLADAEEWIAFVEQYNPVSATIQS